MRYLAGLLAALFVSCAHVEVKNPRNYAQVAGKVYARFVDGPGGVSATAFRYRGQLITAGHFCEHWADFEKLGLVGSMQVQFVSGPGFATSGYFVPRRWWNSKGMDACVLRPVKGAEVPEEMVELEEADPVAIGDPISIVGAPLGLALYRTDGYVAALKEPLADSLMTVSASAFGGNSGSPVLDSEGKLVGMLVAGIPIYPQISIVVPTWLIDSLLDAR